jgi:aminopeptidase
MNQNKTAENFLVCLQSHPSFPKDGGQILLACTTNYMPFCQTLKDTIEGKKLPVNISLYPLDQCTEEEFRREVESADLYLLFYDSDYTAPQMKPPYLLKHEAYLKQTWRKSCVIKNYKTYLDEAFGTPPIEIKAINDRMIELASTAKKMICRDQLGSHLEIDIENLKWTSIDGFGNPDLVPGEIASCGKLNGKIYFTGTFLSTLPFAYNYGLIKESPLYLEFRDNEVVHCKGISKDFEEQFSDFLKFRLSNRRVEEVGIGTNPTVQLHAINAGFEERHIGLHLGLGGAEAGSNHVDLIFQSGEIYFDDKIIIRDEKILI